jgi:hypothetical protein
VATVTDPIGTGETHTTITLWESSLSAHSGDDVTGECKDQTFDEAVTMNDSTPTSVTLSVQSAARHDGTEGTGARIVTTSAKQFSVATPNAYNYRIEWLEYDQNSNSEICFYGLSASFGDVSILANLLIHDASGAGANVNGLVSASTRDLKVQNCIVYNNSRDSGATTYGLQLDSDRADGGCLNNTVYGITNPNTGTGNCTALYIATNSANGTVKNNIVANTTVGGSGTASDYVFGGTNTVSTNNLSEDATADDGGDSGSTHVINATTIDFVSTSPIDLHLNSESSEAHGVGADLGTTDGVEIDIDGTNRDTDIGADAWDMGAHQLVVAGEGGSTHHIHLPLLGVG